MKIEFSEPECSNCYQCSNPGILDTQESEPRDRIGSSITSVPVSSGLVQACGHDSATTVSTSTSSPVQIQALGHDSAATVSTSTSSPFKVLHHSASDPLLMPSHPSSLFSFGSAPAAITSVSSGPAQSPASTPKFGFSTFAAPTPPTSGTMHAHNSGSLFGNNAFAIPDVGSSPVASSSTTTEVFGATPAIFPSPFGPKQAPVQASASSTFTSPLFGCAPASPTTGTWLFNSVFRSTPASSSSDLFGQNSSTTGVGSLPGSPLNSCIPGFGVGYLPGSSSNLFRSNPPNFGGGSVGAGPQRFGLNGATVFPRSPFSSTPAFSNNLNSGSYPFASHEWSRPTEQGSRNPGYAPTHDGENTSGWSFPTEKGKGEIYISISASKPYLHKSHEELRWEDYKQGVKGGSFPAASASPIGSRPNFAFPPLNRPHETATISPPAHGCTACGATSSSSASGHFTFNGTTTPPSAATTPPGLFFPTSGFGPMMFGTTLAVQGTTPALQAYPIQGYILLPFAAMSLQ
ncbi:hypothetical protein ARALYDRAFT_475001 [Arabidopsis lyrata subsp. lyrata]|uniref:Hydroxyproline-rich glycoprotein family protein n=1 Tax=Arabidopsis lyrata subsp. lyrata TaxID=81972 RepID=D7KTG2_ARALL|nr:hypothetical protein ARALYDRAFT_475001 [Arabidopsis lyrata subsp. lyrata]